MAGFFALDQLNCVAADCPEFLWASWGSGFMIALDYYPTYLTVVMYSLSLYQHDLYLFLVSLSLSFDTGINIALLWIIQQPGPFPNCGSTYEMPSFATQHAAIFVCMMSSYAFLWRLSVPSKKIFLMYLFLFSVQLARVYIGSNTRIQLLVGSVVGVVEGLIYQAIIYFVIYPRRRSIMEAHLFGWRVAEFFELSSSLMEPGEEPLALSPAQAKQKEYILLSTYRPTSSSSASARRPFAYSPLAPVTAGIQYTPPPPPPLVLPFRDSDPLRSDD